MNEQLNLLIASFKHQIVESERKDVLIPLVSFIRSKVAVNETINLNFICTHNSRRSHLSQIWAQTMATYFNVKNVYCYSGGTEATAMFPMIGETLVKQGFERLQLSEGSNPVYAIKFSNNDAPVICFSKKYDHPFNPKTGFGAIMTCDSADEACPLVIGAAARFPIKYQDPKAFDGTDLMAAKYEERSLQIASEMYFVFSEATK